MSPWTTHLSPCLIFPTFFQPSSYSNFFVGKESRFPACIVFAPTANFLEVSCVQSFFFFFTIFSCFFPPLSLAFFRPPLEVVPPPTFRFLPSEERSSRLIPFFFPVKHSSPYSPVVLTRSFFFKMVFALLSDFPC